MTSHFKFYPGSEEVVIPWNARYSFPSQANKAIKTTPRIPPKNGETFTPGQTIRFEFPAQGYVNTANTTIVFDCDILNTNPSATNSNQLATWMQNNIQSVFNRGRILYGANPIEDILQYNQIVRNLTEWTSSNNNNFDQFTINEGIGRIVIAPAAAVPKLQHARLKYIHSSSGTGTGVRNVPIASPAATNNNGARRRYQIQLLFGLLTQGKLLPTKFMASQLAIELTLEQAAACMIYDATYFSTGTPGTATATYQLTNLALIPEIFEFDAAYDALFLKGLQDGGVPIKFNKWHTYVYTLPASQIANIMIPERSRSVKALFSIIRNSTSTLATDSGATYSSTNNTTALLSYQYRIGGRYFPASPVQVNYNTTGAFSTGCTEAYLELQKALNMVGDYRLSCAVNAASWGVPFGNHQARDGTIGLDYGAAGAYTATALTTTLTGFDMPAVDNTGTFCMAICLETTNGAEISGLNAEEQSDISLMVNWNGVQDAGYQIETYVLYDALLVLKPNNVMELIE
jgi:hypothetical protein